MKKSILVTGVGGDIALGIIKSLKESSYDLHIVGTDTDKYAVGNKFVDVFCLVSSALDVNYIQLMLDICYKHKIEYIFIASDIEASNLSREKNLFLKHGTRIICLDYSQVNICSNKYFTYQFLRDNNFPFIPTCFPVDLSIFIKKHSFPIIVKPIRGKGSVGVHLIRNKAELELIEDFSNCIVQKYMGDELTVNRIRKEQYKKLKNSIDSF